MMNFVFPAAIQAGIEAGVYTQVFNAAGVAIGMARNAETGQFVAHAVGAALNNSHFLADAMGVALSSSPLSPLVLPMQLIMGGFQMHETKKGFKAVEMSFQAVQASMGVLQATTAVIGVGTFAGVALSAVNLHQTLKLKKAVERLDVKVEKGFIILEKVVKGEIAAIKKLIAEAVADIKFDHHRLVLGEAYETFNGAIQQMRSALLFEDIHLRNAEIVAARGMLFKALAT